MNIIRIVKAIICLMFSSFSLLVDTNNLLDYGINYQFVQHVLAMDTVLPEGGLKYRAITNQTILAISYGFIILFEFITGISLLIGSAGMIKNLKHDTKYSIAKNWIYLGCLTGLILWFFGFIVIGGEWFCMWQSKHWNGVASAFRISTILFMLLVFIGMDDKNR